MEQTKAQMQAEIDTLKAQLEVAHESMSLLAQHLTSEKFHTDPTIQTSDVLAWISNTRSAIADEEFLSRGMCSHLQKRTDAWGNISLVPNKSKGVHWSMDPKFDGYPGANFNRVA